LGAGGHIGGKKGKKEKTDNKGTDEIKRISPGRVIVVGEDLLFF